MVKLSNFSAIACTVLIKNPCPAHIVIRLSDILLNKLNKLELIKILLVIQVKRVLNNINNNTFFLLFLIQILI
jgi:hypothetical protein